MSEKHISLIPKIAIVCLLLVLAADILPIPEGFHKEQMILKLGQRLYVVPSGKRLTDDLYPPIANSDYLKTGTYYLHDSVRCVR
jgi:hypothetical protein